PRQLERTRSGSRRGESGRTNGFAHASPRQGADRPGSASVQEADRAERNAEGAAGPPVLREAMRAAPSGPASQGEGRPQGRRPDAVLSRDFYSYNILGLSRSRCTGEPDGPMAFVTVYFTRG